MNYSTRLKLLLARQLMRASKKIRAKSTQGGVVFVDIGAERLPHCARRALVIYNVSGIERSLRGYSLSDNYFNKHTIYWESVQMVNILNELGYIVDFADQRSPVQADWRRYALVIDQWDNLKNIPTRDGLTTVHWTTYNHWLQWNRGELERLAWFKDRTGVIIPMNRQLPAILSDEYSDYLTYFGTKLQSNSFSKTPEKTQIDISSPWVPPYRKKNFEIARNHFLWIGGGGVVHKGLDLVVEAFTQTPHATLHIVRDMQDEPRFLQWLEQIMAKHENIELHGWMDLTQPEFDAIADNCIGIVYASAAEGGPGAVARVLHNGLIPVVTPTSFVRAETLGLTVTGDTDTAIIASIREHLGLISDLNSGELLARSDAVRDFAQRHHTRKAFTDSFTAFISGI